MLWGGEEGMRKVRLTESREGDDVLTTSLGRNSRLIKWRRKELEAMECNLQQEAQFSG